MNIPGVYNKALDGFILPPRTFFQMFVSAARGAFSLFEEENRIEFIQKLDKGTINEGVISQATAGPMVMLSLHHDLMSPLFRQTKFDASEFLDGIRGGLEQFHNVSGALENELRTIKTDALVNEKREGNATPSDDSEAPETDETKNSFAQLGDDKEAIVAAFQAFRRNSFFPGTVDMNIPALIEHDWADQAKKDSESLAGQLSRMLTTELFQLHQMSTKTSFLLQNHSFSFVEGTSSVQNVALLSARASLCVETEEEASEDDGSDQQQTESSIAPKYEAVGYDMSDDEVASRNGGIAAQIEVLYDVTSEFKEETEKEGSSDENKAIETTVVHVATVEGWLNGGPDGELRWRLALHRPAVEFPGVSETAF